MNVRPLKTYDEIAQSFDTFFELRPHFTNRKSFVAQVMEQQKEGYEVVGVYKDKKIVACIGFRFLTTLAWGRIIYVDDLVTREDFQHQGYAKTLLNHVIRIGRDHLCDQIHLDSGYARHAAHKAYLKQGFEFHCHHLALKLK